MAPLTEQNRTAEFIISEAEHFRAREGGIVNGGADGLVAGTVLGQRTADDIYAIYDPTVTDGSESVAGILYEGVTGTARRTLYVRQCQVKSSKLSWFDGATPAQIATGVTELSTRGIIVR